MSVLMVIGVTTPLVGVSAYHLIKAHRTKMRRLARRDRWAAEARHNMDRHKRTPPLP